MGKDARVIDTFLRVRPTKRHSERVSVDQREKQAVFMHERPDATGTSTAVETQRFDFTGVLGEDAQQEEVFDKVARPVILSALSGSNGTIFAYGQTGSGKTFTITGGSEKYSDRGIIPRAVSFIFSQMSKRSDAQYSIHLSYMEVYNEQPHDLLHEANQASSSFGNASSSSGLDSLRKVTLREDDDGELHFSNLSVHRANTEEEALNLLFLGDTNRAISETPMNMASSRSHCIFSVSIEARVAGTEKIRRSKLNLVDLAGSERASKTGLDGSILLEAKYINVSLHYLQQVVVALQERGSGHSRPHVPYRNSALTSILRDSLGGNCRTVMIANISPEPSQVEESISTCKFAQRVAMVSNTVQVNEDTDPSAVIKRLKQENRQMKEEIKLLKGTDTDERSQLTQGEHDRIKKQVERYAQSPPVVADEQMPEISMNMLEIKATWRAFHELMRSCRGVASNATATGSAPAGSAEPCSPDKHRSEQPSRDDGHESHGDTAAAAGSDEDMSEQVRKLKLQVKQRDNEINILVSMLEKQQSNGTAPKISNGKTDGYSSASTINAIKADRKQSQQQLQEIDTEAHAQAICETAEERRSPRAGKVEDKENQQQMKAGSATIPSKDVLSNTDLLANRSKAFELFQNSYKKREAIEENKQELKAKYERAKALGQAVNDSRSAINDINAKLQKRREQLSVAALSADVSWDDAERDDHVISLKQELEGEKQSYRESFNNLRDIKAEIEHLQRLLDTSKQKLQSDFEEWLRVAVKQQRETKDSSSPASPSPAEAAAAAAEERQSGRDASQGERRRAWQDANANGASYPVEEEQGTTSSSSNNNNRESEQLRRSVAEGTSRLTNAPPSTGDDQADADIRAFYEARQRLVSSST